VLPGLGNPGNSRLESPGNNPIEYKE